MIYKANQLSMVSSRREPPAKGIFEQTITDIMSSFNQSILQSIVWLLHDLNNNNCSDSKGYKHNENKIK